mmetsp:Transcript_32235/g.86009  ORF Transcript_32235/g.86009 Transcript_32235/m.86009 type:complete len:423 (+) Transcript_32235:317-1585(+)
MLSAPPAAARSRCPTSLANASRTAACTKPILGPSTRSWSADILVRPSPMRARTPSSSASRSGATTSTKRPSSLHVTAAAEMMAPPPDPTNRFSMSADKNCRLAMLEPASFSTEAGVLLVVSTLPERRICPLESSLPKSPNPNHLFPVSFNLFSEHGLRASSITGAKFDLFAQISPSSIFASRVPSTTDFPRGQIFKVTPGKGSRIGLLRPRPPATEGGGTGRSVKIEADFDDVDTCASAPSSAVANTSESSTSSDLIQLAAFGRTGPRATTRLSLPPNFLRNRRKTSLSATGLITIFCRTLDGAAVREIAARRTSLRQLASCVHSSSALRNTWSRTQPGANSVEGQTSCMSCTNLPSPSADAARPPRRAAAMSSCERAKAPPALQLRILIDTSSCFPPRRTVSTSSFPKIPLPAAAVVSLSL